MCARKYENGICGRTWTTGASLILIAVALPGIVEPRGDAFHDVWPDLKEAVLFLFDKHFGRVRKLAIHFDEKTTEQADEIIRSVRVPVMVNAAETEHPEYDVDTRIPSDVILTVDNSFGNPHGLLGNSAWTTKTFFVSCLDADRGGGDDDDDDDDAREKKLLDLFQMYWMENVLNVVAAVVGTRGRVRLFTYRLLLEKGCDKLEILELGNRPVRNEQGREEEKNKVVSGGRRATDFHGCVLNVSAVHLPPMVIFPDDASRQGTFFARGTEPALIEEVSKRLNFTARYAVPEDGLPWGWIRPSPRGVVGEVFSRKSHFGMGHLVATIERLRYLDVSVPVAPLMECITFAVPVGAAKKQAVWIEIYASEFSLNLWLCAATAFSLSLLTVRLLARRYAIAARDLSQACLYLFSAFLNMPVRAPLQHGPRTFFLGYVWYSFVMVVSYESLMRSKLTVPYRPREIDTIRDLVDSDLSCRGFYNIIKVVTHEAEGDMKMLSGRCQATKYGIKEAVDRILFDRNIAYVREITSFKYYTLNNPQAKGKVHFMKECASRYYPIMVLQRNSPVTRTLNEIAGRLFETGILTKWRSRYIYELAPGSPSVVRLSLRHTFAPFLVLMLGTALSLTAFLAELAYNRIQRNNTRRNPTNTNSRRRVEQDKSWRTK